MAELILQSQMDQKKFTMPSSFYKQMSLTPQGTNITTIGASTQQLLFEIGADQVINLSKTVISFNRGKVYNSDNTTASTPTSGYFNIPTNYCPFFKRIELYTSNNIRLVDIQDVDLLNKIASPCNLNFLENTSMNGLLFPSYRKNGNADLVNGDFYINSGINGNAIIGYCNNDGTLNGANYANDSPFGSNRKICIRLGDILVDSILNCDQDLYFGKVLYLRIQLNDINKILLDHNLNATNFTSVNNKLLRVSNFKLNVYSQANPLIAQLIKENNNKGQTVYIPQVYSNSYQLIGSGNKSSILKVLSDAVNCRLYKVYSCLVNSNKGTNLNILNTSNIDKSTDVDGTQGKYNYINFYLNNNMLLNLDITQNDDLNLILNQYGSHSFTDFVSFKDCGVFSYVFDSQKIEKGELQYNGNIIKGIQFPTSNEHSLQIQYNTLAVDDNISNNANYTNYIFAVVMKEIYLKSGDVSLVPYL